MTINRNGSIAFAAPFGYVHHIGPPAMSSYSLSGTTFVTDALLHEGYGCASSGAYRWRLSAATLKFTVLKDDCPYRPAVFASNAWERR